MSCEVTVLAGAGYLTITPPGRGDQVIPTTKLRVPGAVTVKLTDLTDDELTMTPAPLSFVAHLRDRISGLSATAPIFRAAQFVDAHVGDWIYEVAQLSVGDIDHPVTSATLTTIRLSALLRYSLRGLVSVVSDSGLSIGSADLDDRAVTAYLIAQLVGDHPTTAVARELDVSTNTAAQRVHRLRRTGRLPAYVKKGSS